MRRLVKTTFSVIVFMSGLLCFSQRSIAADDDEHPKVVVSDDTMRRPPTPATDPCEYISGGGGARGAVLPSVPSIKKQTAVLSKEYMLGVLSDLDAHVRSGGIPEAFAFVFDVHGVLTTIADPSDIEDDFGFPRVQIVWFFNELRRYGATVVASSAWPDPENIRKSLIFAGLADFVGDAPLHVTHEDIMGSSAKVMRMGHVISVQEDSSPDRIYYRGKAFAGFLAAKEARIPLERLYLMDDSKSNLELFHEQALRARLPRELHSPKGLTVITVEALPMIHRKFRVSLEIPVDLRSHLTGMAVEVMVNGVAIALLDGKLFGVMERLGITDGLPMNGNDLDSVVFSYRVIDAEAREIVREECFLSSDGTHVIPFINDGKPLEAVRLRAVAEVSRPLGIRFYTVGAKYNSLPSLPSALEVRGAPAASGGGSVDARR